MFTLRYFDVSGFLLVVLEPFWRVLHSGGWLPLKKNRYAMRTCVCFLEIIVGYVVLSYTVQNVGFVGFVWCHVCFAALKINETVGKKIKNLKDKVSGS